MKKISKLFMFAVLALGLSFAACNNDDVPQGPNEQEGNTHVSVVLSMSSLRSASETGDEDYNYVDTWGGIDLIKSVSIYLVDPASTGPVTRSNFLVGPNQPYTFDEATNMIEPQEAAAIKTTAGQKDVWVVVNENAVVQQHLVSATASDFAKKYQEIALVLEHSELGDFNPKPETSATKLANLENKEGKDFDVIVMTNVEPALNADIKANVSQSATITDSENRVKLKVERAVARVLVTIKEGFTEIVKDVNGVDIGTISNVNWVLAQGESSLFVQRNTNPWNWATPNWEWVPTDGGDDYYAEAGDFYDYSGLYEGYEKAPKFGGNVVETKALSGAGNIGEASMGKGRFILPTTHLHGAFPTTDAAYTGGYKKGNTAYVLIRAQFTPTDAAYADGSTYEEDADFYLGANGKFYSSANNAISPEKGGVVGQTVAKYVGGKVLYYAWVNPDNAEGNNKGKWYNSPVLRNNIYHINITGFKTIGTNWNPLFPEDPTTVEPPYLPNENYDPKEPFVPGENDPYMPNEDFDPEKPVGPDNIPYLPNPEFDPEKPITPGDNSPAKPNDKYDPENPSKNPDPKPYPEFTPNPDPEKPGEPIIPEEPTNPIDPKDPLTTPETWMSVDVRVLPWKVHSYGIEF